MTTQITTACQGRATLPATTARERLAPGGATARSVT